MNFLKPMMDKVGIINIGIGSLISLKNCLNKINIETEYCYKPDDLFNYNNIILPGVGNFGNASDLLFLRNWNQSISDFLKERNRKLMGICLGFQILFEESEESNNSPGLALMKGKISHLKTSHSFRIPHVGWNNINILKKDSFLSFIKDPIDVYFVHSYALAVNRILDLEQFDEYTITEHGENKFISSFRSGNIYGCQFHPEKSSKVGMKFFKSFFD